MAVAPGQEAEDADPAPEFRMPGILPGVFERMFCKRGDEPRSAAEVHLMSPFVEYDKPMRPSIFAAFAFLSCWAVPLCLTVSAQAQINGAPSSVTSPGFGGRPVNGPPASVTSVGPRGYAPVPRPGFIPNTA